MKIIISSKDMPVSEALEARVTKKVNKLARYFDDDIELQVRMALERGNRNILEITVPIPGTVLRVEEVNDDMYKSIDRALAKLERQLHKHRTKLEKRLKEGAFEQIEREYADSMQPEANAQLVKTKRFYVKPMNTDDAIIQMDLLGHNFFIFLNEETGTVCTVYKRADGDYGLLIPETA